jgi:hypothetical protein
MMCSFAWSLIAGIIISGIALKWWLEDVRLEIKRAKGILDRAEIIERRARNTADEILAKARKERDQWKFAKMLSDATGKRIDGLDQ